MPPSRAFFFHLKNPRTASSGPGPTVTTCIANRSTRGGGGGGLAPRGAGEVVEPPELPVKKAEGGGAARVIGVNADGTLHVVYARGGEEERCPIQCVSWCRRGASQPLRVSSLDPLLFDWCTENRYVRYPPRQDLAQQVRVEGAREGSVLVVVWCCVSRVPAARVSSNAHCCLFVLYCLFARWDRQLYFTEKLVLAHKNELEPEEDE